MCDLEFVIPVNKDELLESHPGQYHVEDIVQPRLLLSSLQDAARAYNSDGIDYIFEHFSTYFSILVHGNKLEWDTLNKGFDHMERSLKMLSNNLDVILHDSDIVPEVRHKNLNLIKMIMFLYTAIIKVKDAKLTAENATKLTLGKKGRRKDDRELENDNAAWSENDKLNALCSLYNIISMPLQRLWDPPLAEENFVAMVAEPCYKTLEEQTIKSKPVRETVFQILGALIKSYNHATSCLIRLVQVMQMHEHAVSATCAGVSQLTREMGLVTFGPQIAREIADTLAATPETEGAGPEQSGAKNLGSFLVELTREIPNEMMAAIPTLQPHLDIDECYSVRISVLGMMEAVLSAVLKGEDLNDQQKELRDQLLDDLQDHIHDVSAHVRSKVLQYWCKLQRDNCIPVNRQKTLLPLVAGRLRDKAALVRKHAISLLKIFIEFNPFSSQLKLEILKEQLESENKILQDLQKQVEPQPDPVLVKKWEDIQDEVFEAVEERVDQATQDDPELSQRSLEDIYESIRRNIRAGDYFKALMLVRYTERQYPHAKLLRCSMDKADQVQYFTTLMRNVFVVPDRRQSITVSQECDNEIAIYKKIEEKEMVVAFLTESVSFCSILAEAIPVIESLLLSKQAGDVAEAIDFFKSAHQFKVDAAKHGVCKMLHLVWSQDQDKRDAVERAYRDMYLESDAKSDRARSFEIASNLVALLLMSDRASALAIEPLLHKWTDKGDIGASVIQVLWEMFSSKLDGTTAEQSRAALSLLATIAKAKPSVATANVELIQSIGLTGDYKTRELSCQLLLALEKNDFRYPAEHDLMNAIKESIAVTFLKNKLFTSMAGYAVDVVYGICDTPEVVASEILAQCYKILDNHSEKQEPDQWKCPTELVGRFVYLLGHIAMRQLIHLDVSLYCELRRRNQVREDRKNQEKMAETAKRRARGKNQADQLRRQTLLNLSSASASARTNRSASITSKINSSINDEESCSGLEGAVADDADAEYVRAVCENNVTSPSTSLGRYGPLLAYAIKEVPDIRAIAATALSRYMLVSSVTCEENLQLLVSVLKGSKDPAVRINLLCSFTDLTLRFPNLTQPWTDHVYQALQDRDVQVRRCAVKVLSFLILHEMVRVKGQIAELARATVDDDHTVRTLARHFFKQLSTKGNGLYNVMPDIISRLSDPASELEEEDFRTIMKFITAMIQKERQTEALVDKLCQRFKLSTDEKQWRELSYCLSLYSYNEKSLRRLIDNVSSFKDKLYSKGVYDNFKTLMNSAAKSAKNEIKILVTELNDKIEECFAVTEDQRNSDDENVNPYTNETNAVPRTPTAPRTPSTRARRNAATPRGGKTPRGKKKAFDFDSDESDEECPKDLQQDAVFKRPAVRSTRPQRNKK